MQNSEAYEEKIAPLLGKYAKGGKESEEAFSALAELFLPLMNKIISSFGISESEIDDAKQEALIGLHRAIELYDAELSSFSTFAYICMKSSVVSYLRRIPRKNEIPLQSEALLDIPAADCDPAGKIIGDEEKDSILKKIEKELTDFEMQVLLFSIAGEDNGAISKKLGKSKKSIENALFRGREKIRRFIKV